MVDVLIVEDNREMARLLCDFLAREGFSCYHAQSGEDGVAFAAREGARIALLDLMLPGMDGFEVCRLLRERANLPILMLSARTAKEDKLTGLLSGADDYIEKPFDVDILLAKVRSVYRRNYEQRELLTDGNLEMDTAARIVRRDGEVVPLTVKEYDLLLHLLRNRDITMRKEQLFDEIWGADSFSEPATLTVHIKWLRQKLEEDPKNPRRIVTVWGVGYRWESGRDA